VEAVAVELDDDVLVAPDSIDVESPHVYVHLRVWQPGSPDEPEEPFLELASGDRVTIEVAAIQGIEGGGSLDAAALRGRVTVSHADRRVDGALEFARWEDGGEIEERAGRSSSPAGRRHV
jgi:hypothetical protein